MSARHGRALAALAAVPAAALALLAGAAPASAAPASVSHTVSYCHATGSTTNPYVFITTDKTAVVRAHAAHQNERDIVPAFSYESQGRVLAFPGLNTTRTSVPSTCVVAPTPDPWPWS
jgi:ABC-type sugar transport system substrate-binding protein